MKNQIQNYQEVVERHLTKFDPNKFEELAQSTFGTRIGELQSVHGYYYGIYSKKASHPIAKTVSFVHFSSGPRKDGHYRYSKTNFLQWNSGNVSIVSILSDSSDLEKVPTWRPSTNDVALEDLEKMIEKFKSLPTK